MIEHVRDLLKDIGIPIADRYYAGKQSRFITVFLIDRLPFDYSDDEENGNRFVIQLSFFYDKPDDDVKFIISEYNRIMVDNEFFRIGENELYDNQSRIFSTVSRFYYKQYDV